jgi:internalin A
MTKQQLLKRIEQAAKKRRTGLDLNREGLTELPAEIAQLSQLQTLSLNGNQLTTLPPEIAQLSQLQWLDLSGNQLTTLPPEIAQLSQLQWLDLSGNQLTTLLPEIAQLSQLQGLLLSRTQLTTFPPEIAQLLQLRRLDLSGNQLTTLPPEIAQLLQLQTLSLSGNQLTTLLPEIAQLSQLQTLGLSYNRLTYLPLEIAQLSQLQKLDLRNNPLPIPPDILEKHDNPTEIITYYLNLIKAKRPLNEAKMLLVGQGGVGKTSLVNRLLDNTYNPQENKTEGIAIRNWSITPVNQPPIRVNVWDFGGQEIMHATHQFFLTKRSLYLLVLDARQGENESRLEYWLKIVHSFGEDSPILVIINKIDQQPLDLDRKGLLAKYPNLKAFFDISCQTGKGIDDLKVALTQWIDKLEHVHDPFPQAWFSVKDRLAKMQQDYLSYDDYVKLCQKENIQEEKSQRTLIGFMHDLGIALNFRDDPQRPHLAETNILNPEWVTQGVYSLLNNHTLAQQHGVLNTTQLPELLNSHRYPTHKQHLIVEIMEKFELCFAFDGREQFLIPDLLGKEQVNQVKTWDYANSLAFQYHYDVLPPSVISRFIVRMHQRIWERTYWRTGVILAMDNNQALVRTDLEDKKVLIWVTGTDAGKRALLAVIRAEFERIHKSISKLQVTEQVPYKGIVIPYRNLLKLEEKGIRTHYYPEIDEDVDVVKLLSGIEAQYVEDLDDFTSLETKVSQLAKSLPQGEAKEWCEALQTAIAVARIDLESAIARGRQILETIVARVYQDTFPQKHHVQKHSGKIDVVQLYSMIEELKKVPNLFSGAVIADMHYVRITGNLVLHKQDQKIDFTPYNVQIALLMVANLVEWYLHK